MTNYSTSANVVLSVNGKQAKSMLASLQKDAERLEQKLAKAAAAGDKATMQKLRRELTQTNKLIQQIQGSTENVEQVLRRLDKASPKELQKTLRTLTRQLNGIERGSEAWEAHTAKIKRVKAELRKLNEETREGEGAWERFNRKMNDWQTTIAAGAAALTGMVMMGRSAVNAYADMEAEMANVRKFTGMTEEEVAALNEKFKKMDTRTSRENLNKLAQEAGRLGKTSSENVLGFVRAANQINVALDDLGDGATLTLSKLTNIFGDEERLGTERSLLAVGSVINELSQNSTASAPYLAQFAQRLAGVGKQAEMTIPQIMGYAAVLDSTGQGVEMSATALSQLIMGLFKDSAKIARATGMDLEAFNKALKSSTNEGLVMLLERLHELGGIDVLAPVFEGMGADGARASAVIAALAGNVETLKWQQEQANAAFAEATSITKEYDVQNTTVQAGLDKARKRVTELAVTLGEKLQPVMAHVMSSTTLALKLMGTLIDFVGRNIGAITSLAAVIVVYTLAVNASNIALKVHYGWLVATKTAATAYHGTVKALHAAHLLLQVGLAKLSGNWARQSALMLDLKKAGASLATGWGVLAAAAVALGMAIYKAVKKADETRETLKRQREEAKKQAREMRDISAAAAANAQNEITQIKALYKAVTDETKSKEERIKAAKRLKEMYPSYFRKLEEEAILVGKAKTQYENLTKSILAAAKAKAAAAKIEENEGKKMELEMKNEQLAEKLDKAEKARDTARQKFDKKRADEKKASTTEKLKRTLRKERRRSGKPGTHVNMSGGEMKPQVLKRKSPTMSEK